MKGELITDLPCADCGQPVVLTAAQTDERGRAVHPDCYWQRMDAERSAMEKAS